jgi:hypothetical protein
VYQRKKKYNNKTTKQADAENGKMSSQKLYLHAAAEQKSAQYTV